VSDLHSNEILTNIHDGQNLAGTDLMAAARQIVRSLTADDINGKME
jgi:hypothetical protein